MTPKPPNTLNVFTGSDGLKHYLDPSQGVPTPLVELPPSLNPYAGTQIRIYAKLLNMLPLGNVKSIPAVRMLQDAQTDKTQIIESSSGNTVASLGVLAAHYGFTETHALVSHEVTRGKLDMLRLFGVQPIINREPICPSENDDTSGIKKARKLGQGSIWFNPDQYSNPSNVEAHYAVTGAQLWAQSAAQIDYFCAGLGTTGTVLGTSRYLKEQNPQLQTIGIVRAPNNPVPGPLTKNLLNDVAFNWREQCDDLVEVGTKDAYITSLKMIRQGLIVGPSSGMALAGVLQYVQQHPRLLEGPKDTSFAFICCDSALPYVDEYFKYVPADMFPDIKNKHLLLQTDAPLQRLQTNAQDVITPQEVQQQLADPNTALALIDLRSHDAFESYHIPNAVNIPEGDFISNITVFADLYHNKQTVLICAHGETAGLLAPYARGKGFAARVLEGGMMEWSRQHLPRTKDSACPIGF